MFARSAQWCWTDSDIFIFLTQVLLRPSGGIDSCPDWPITNLEVNPQEADLLQILFEGIQGIPERPIGCHQEV